MFLRGETFYFESLLYIRLQIKKRVKKKSSLSFGTLEGTRTPDLLVRSQSLYPTELPAHTTLNALKYSITPYRKKQVLF